LAELEKYPGGVKIKPPFEMGVVNLKEIVNTSICVDVCIPEKLTISDMDLTSMLGNLLDNSLRAIEEVNENGKKSVLCLNLNYTKGRLMLRIENSYLAVSILFVLVYIK